MTLGIIDWGIGGLGVVQALDRVVPALPVLYWSDTGATPYGRMRTAELTTRLSSIVVTLAGLGATEVVLACNAASTVTGRLASAPIPVEGIIEHGIASVPDDVDGPIGVVAGRRTIASGAYRRGLTGRTVLSRVAQPLSAHIEAGAIGSTAFRVDLLRIIEPLRTVRALVLACTHYPAAASAFEDALPGVALIDPAQRMAAAVARRHPSACGGPRAARTYFTTGDPDAMRRSAAAAWGVDLTARRR